MKSDWKPVTVRFARPAYQALAQIASEHDLALADVVRLAVDMDLERLDRRRSKIRFMDAEQGADIQRQLLVLINAMQTVRFELHRIGVNYNQEVKLLHMEQTSEDELIESLEQRKKAIREEYAKMRHSGLDEMMMQNEERDKKLADIDAEIEEAKNQKDETRLDVDAVKKLLDLYCKASKEVGDVLCRILA